MFERSARTASRGTKGVKNHLGCLTKTMCSRWGAYGAAAYGLVIVMIHNRSRRRQIKYTLPPLKMDDGSCEEEKKSLEEEEEVGFEVERDNLLCRYII